MSDITHDKFSGQRGLGSCQHCLCGGRSSSKIIFSQSDYSTFFLVKLTFRIKYYSWQQEVNLINPTLWYFQLMVKLIIPSCWYFLLVINLINRTLRCFQLIIHLINPTWRNFHLIVDLINLTLWYFHLIDPTMQYFQLVFHITAYNSQVDKILDVRLVQPGLMMM